MYIKINDAKSIENAKKNSLCHFFGGQQKYLQEDRTDREKSALKKNSGISNWKNVKVKKLVKSNKSIPRIFISF